MNIQFSFATAMAHVLLHSVWQLALLALLASASFSLMQRAGAGLRHAVGMVWLTLMAAVPIATFAMFWQSPSTVAGAMPSPLLPLPVAVDVAGAALSVQSWTDWVAVFAAELWLAGVTLMMALQLNGWRWLGRLERQPFIELPPAWRERSEALRLALGISRQVALRLGRDVVSPFTARVLRPVIWLPATFLTQLPPDQIEALIAHELAHISRLDWIWNGWQCLIESLLFFHPGMWWLSRRIRQEREHACDDLAVAVCGDAIALAEALAALGRRGLASPRLALAAEGGSLMKRISHLLSGTPMRQNWRVSGALLLLLCSGALFAMQVDPPRHVVLNLKSEASSDGPLTPGNFREFTADYLIGKQRHYRVSMDARGQIEEVYEEGGQRKPVDATVLAWLREVETMSGNETQRVGAATPSARPPIPSIPALPPLPPVPPAPPKITDSAEMKQLLQTLQSEPGLVAAVGAPFSIEPGSFHGHIRVWSSWDIRLWGIDDPEGAKSEFTATVSGPKGQARLHYAGETRNGRWQASTLEVSPLPNH